MEDRHCIVTALKPASTAAAAAGAAAGSNELATAANGVSALVAGTAGYTSMQGHLEVQQRPSVMHDGVERSYAAIFDGHNGAGAAETAGM